MDILEGMEQLARMARKKSLPASNVSDKVWGKIRDNSVADIVSFKFTAITCSIFAAVTIITAIQADIFYKNMASDLSNCLYWPYSSLIYFL